MASQERAENGAEFDHIRAVSERHFEGEDVHRLDDEPTAPQDGDSNVPEEYLAPEPGSALDSAIHTLIAAIRQEFARERKRERENMRVEFQRRVRQLEIEANTRIREKLSRARVRDKEKLLERARRLDDMFAKLSDLAREVAAQKVKLQKSRAEFEQKLMESDFIQTELRHIGEQIGEQIESFGDSLPDDQFLEELEEERKAS